MFKIILLDLLKEYGLSQAEFSRRSKIPIPTISGWINLERLPDFNALKKLALFFDVSTDYLLGLEDDFGNKTSETNNAQKAATSLTIDEREMLALWRELPQDKKDSILNIIKK